MSHEEEKIVRFALERGTTLRSIYRPGYKFPRWVLPKFAQCPKSCLNLLTSARVYFPSEANLETVKRLVRQREPVNMGGSRCFDPRKLNKAFGWSRAFYSKYFERNNALAPNIAVYSLTLLPKEGGEAPWQVLHVLNVIGFALDHPDQPDFRVLDHIPPDQRRDWLQGFYRQIFRMIFTACRQAGCDRVVLSAFGAGVFSSLYNDDQGQGSEWFRQQIWIPALRAEVAALQLWRPRIDFMGQLDKWAEWPLIEGSIDLGNFPHLATQIDPFTTMLVNAWDPLTIVGNGNAKDNTLDGYFGRNTSLALTTSSMTNALLEDDAAYIAVS